MLLINGLDERLRIFQAAGKEAKHFACINFPALDLVHAVPAPKETLDDLKAIDPA